MTKSELIKLLNDSFNLDEFLAIQHVVLIRTALEMKKGNISRAAQRLGIKRTTLTSRIRSLGIEKEDK